MATLLRRLVLLVLPIALWQAPLGAQGSKAWAQCRTDSLSNFNCAGYYSGTLTLSHTTKGSGINDAFSVIATVAAGKVTCRVKSTEDAEFEAPGMIAVEHGSNMDAGKYEISVWCPDAAGKKPKRGDSPMIRAMHQTAADYAKLVGTDGYEEVDEANGVTENEKVTWDLRRK